MEEAFTDDVRIMTSMDPLEYASLQLEFSNAILFSSIPFSSMQMYAERFLVEFCDETLQRGLISSRCKISKEHFHGK